MGVAASGGASVTWRSNDIAGGSYNIRSPKALYHPTTNNWVVIFKETGNNTGIKVKAFTPGTNYTDSITQGQRMKYSLLGLIIATLFMTQIKMLL